MEEGKERGEGGGWMSGGEREGEVEGDGSIDYNNSRVEEK